MNIVMREKKIRSGKIEKIVGNGRVQHSFNGS